MNQDETKDIHHLHDIVQKQAETIALHMQHDEAADTALDVKISRVQDSHDRDTVEIKEKLDLILTQTTKTNGRVNKLESWQSWVTGGIAAFSLVLVPLFGWVLFKIATMESTVQNAVSQALIPYQN